MTIHDFINAHPDNHLRIIRYVPAPETIDEHGHLVLCGTSTSTVVFDSTTGDGDLAFDLMLQQIINDPEEDMTDEDRMDPDYCYELEYMPEEYW